jgi:excisionase family DNA binding protein
MIDLGDRRAFTPEQVAEILGCSRITVYRYLNSGELVGIKVGKVARRVLREDLEAYLNHQRELELERLAERRAA